MSMSMCVQMHKCVDEKLDFQFQVLSTLSLRQVFLSEDATVPFYIRSAGVGGH